MSFLQNILKTFVAPEEHNVGAAIAAAYAANKATVVAQLTAKGVNVAKVLEADADALIPEAFAKLGPAGAVLEPILGPVAVSAVNGLIEKAVTNAPNEAALVEAYADSLVAKLVAQLEAA